MGLDPLKVHLPTQVLSIHLAHIGHEKGIFISWSACIGVDTLDACLGYVFRQLVPKLFAMSAAMIDCQ